MCHQYIPLSRHCLALNMAPTEEYEDNFQVSLDLACIDHGVIGCLHRGFRAWSPTKPLDLLHLLQIKFNAGFASV